MAELRLLSYGVVLALCSVAQGELVLQIDEVNLPFSATAQNASVEVFFSSSDLTLPSISAHQVRVRLDDPLSGIAITSAGAPTAHSYLGPSSAPLGVSISGDATTVDAGDIDFLNTVPLFNGAGLLRVQLTVPAATPVGIYPIVFDVDANRTFLADGANQLLGISLVNGAIEISSISSTGDYNNNGVVDAADYTVWRDTLGQSVTRFSGADGDGDSTIGQGDYSFWKARFGNIVGVSATGDYSGNGVVDAADYTVWRDTLGQSVTRFSGADGDGDSTIGQGDYTFWKSRFGTVVGSGAVASHTVPEPASMGVFALSFLSLVVRTRCLRVPAGVHLERLRARRDTP
jgi:hypothetical protein